MDNDLILKCAKDYRIKGSRADLTEFAERILNEQERIRTKARMEEPFLISVNDGRLVIDVIENFAARGMNLPHTPTMTGIEILWAVGIDTLKYTLYLEAQDEDRMIKSDEHVILERGMKFYALPAITGG